MYEDILQKHFKAYYSENGLDTESPERAEFSLLEVKNTDFPALLSSLVQKLFDKPDFDIFGVSDPKAEDFADNFHFVKAYLTKFEACSFYGLELFQCDFRKSTFEDCDLRHISQAHFTSFDDVKFIRPKLTIDHNLHFIDWATCAEVADPEFYDYQDRRVYGARFDENYRVIYNPSLSDAFSNLKNGINIKRVFEDYNALYGIKGMIQNSLKQAFQKLHGPRGLKNDKNDPPKLDK